MRTFPRILVPMDRSELSHQALEVALTLARATGAEQVIALEVRARAAALEGPRVALEIDDLERESQALQERVNARAQATDVPQGLVRSEVRAGPVEATILGAATDHQVDLIIMGTHGRSGLAEQLTGSTSERIANRATASVMVVKPEGYPYLRDG